MYFNSDKDFNISLPNALLMKYVLYYNIVFPKQNMFKADYTLMSNACGTLSIAYNGSDVLAELWGAAARPNLLGGGTQSISCNVIDSAVIVRIISIN